MSVDDPPSVDAEHRSGTVGGGVPAVDVVEGVGQGVHGRLHDVGGIDRQDRTWTSPPPWTGSGDSYPAPITYVRTTHANAVAVNSAVVPHNRSSTVFRQSTRPRVEDGASTAIAVSTL